MASVSTENYSGNRTFDVVAPTAFDASGPILVEPGVLPNSVLPLTATIANRIGVYVEKLQAGDGDSGKVNVRLLNAGGTIRVKTSDDFAYGEYALAATGGTVTASATVVTGVVGQYLGPAVSSGAIIEILNGAPPVIVA
tara:strand:- start:4111 stop:4527 length:417 start_codon:yes stop_codon:yes gene_type:complete